MGVVFSMYMQMRDDFTVYMQIRAVEWVCANTFGGGSQYVYVNKSRGLGVSLSLLTGCGCDF